MDAFRFVQACEEYEIGLSVMLQAARGKILSMFFSFFTTFISSGNQSDKSENSPQCGKSLSLVRIFLILVGSSVNRFLII